MADSKPSFTLGTPPHVVIIGGGFAGLAVAKGLERADARVTVIDRANHHLFQPLLYQVATAGLSPANIAAPIRKILARQRNADVMLGEVLAIDATARAVRLRSGQSIAYDYLVLATGVRHAYFGHEEWERFAPGLKTIEDALEVRRRFLLAFESAEIEPDPARRAAMLTFVIVGGGPTGVEIAGAMAEIAHKSVPRDFRHIDTTSARIILIEAQDRVLTSFPLRASAAALRQLKSLGVQVRLNTRVTAVDSTGVNLGDERLDAGSVTWAAGVYASPLGAQLGAPVDRSGRVLVAPDLSVPGHPEILIAGDLASLTDPVTNEEVPGVAPAAMQMGRHVARLLANELRALRNGQPAPQRPAFRYVNKGIVATIGRNRAVAFVWGRVFSGYPAWLLWALVHVFYLIGFRRRLFVMLEWMWMYVFFTRGARLITETPDSLAPSPSPVPGRAP